MQRSHKRRRVNVPSVTTIKQNTQDYKYIKGFNTNLANDEVSSDQWRYITDSREIQIGKWMTRQGTNAFSIPVGEIVNVQQVSTTGASVFNFGTQTWFAKKLIATTTGRLTAINANLLNPNNATGTIVYALYTDNSGVPGTEIFRTTVSNSKVLTTASFCLAGSITCPDITSGTTYWAVGFVQAGGSGLYQITTTTNATTGLTSTNSGTTWNTTTFDFNVSLRTAPATPIKGHIRVKRPSGTTYTFKAVGTVLYSVNEGTGVTTSVDTGIGSTSTFVRFAFVNDTLYYVDGTQKPRKLDMNLLTATSVTNAPENATNLIVHKGLIFYQSADDVNKSFYTNFGLYDTFTSTDFFYVDSPKTSDPQKAYARLNGNLYIITRNSKFILYGSENATFRLDNAIGQKGTFSQASVAYNEDKIYLAADDGIYEFNGAQEVNIASDVLDWWISLTNKSNTVMELYNHRLYVYYTPVGQAQNSACRIYNTLYGIWESEDTKTYIATSYSRYDNDNYMLIGSNRVGLLMFNERVTNDYNNMGEPLTFELRTSYNPAPGPKRRYTWTTSSEYKRVSLYRPHFDTITGNYTIQCGYAFDYSELPQYFDVTITSSGPRFNTTATFDSGLRFGGYNQVNPLDNAPIIAGEFRRLQIRYKHYAAREPVSFDGHVLGIETQRAI